MKHPVKLSKQCSSNVQAAAAGSCTLNSLVLEVDEPKRLKAHIGELEDHEAHSTFHISRLAFLGSSQHKPPKTLYFDSCG